MMRARSCQHVEARPIVVAVKHLVWIATIVFVLDVEVDNDQSATGFWG